MVNYRLVTEILLVGDHQAARLKLGPEGEKSQYF